MKNRSFCGLIILVIVLLAVNGCGGNNKKKQAEKLEKLRQENQNLRIKTNQLTEECEKLDEEINKLRNETLQKSEEFGKINQENTDLRSENSQFRRDLTRKEIVSQGKGFLSIQIFLLILITNNIIWFIIYKKKR